MKKVVLIILAILPIFLVITISFAGRILSLYQHIPVEKVYFIDENGEEFDTNSVLKINIGEEKQTNIKILPELATNKKVSYFSDDEEICSVDEQGKIKGIKLGNAQITVTTQEGSKIAILSVFVTKSKVESVSLSHELIEIIVGESRVVEATVAPHTADNKNVIFSSSDESIAQIDPTGKITAVGVGEAIITVETVDGGLKDTCKVICKQGKEPIAFDFSGDLAFIKQGQVYKTYLREINLLNYLEIDEEKVKIEDVSFKVNQGSAEIVDGKLTINSAGLVKITAYAGSYQKELTLWIN